jgi:hypothetical protein
MVEDFENLHWPFNWTSRLDHVMDGWFNPNELNDWSKVHVGIPFRHVYTSCFTLTF